MWDILAGYARMETREKKKKREKGKEGEMKSTLA